MQIRKFLWCTSRQIANPQTCNDESAKLYQPISLVSHTAYAKSAKKLKILGSQIANLQISTFAEEKLSPQMCGFARLICGPPTFDDQ